MKDSDKHPASLEGVIGREFKDVVFASAKHLALSDYARLLELRLESYENPGLDSAKIALTIVVERIIDRQSSVPGYIQEHNWLNTNLNFRRSGYVKNNDLLDTATIKEDLHCLKSALKKISVPVG